MVGAVHVQCGLRFGFFWLVDFSGASFVVVGCGLPSLLETLGALLGYVLELMRGNNCFWELCGVS